MLPLSVNNPLCMRVFVPYLHQYPLPHSRNIGCENLRIWVFSSFDCANITFSLGLFWERGHENQQYGLLMTIQSNHRQTHIFSFRHIHTHYMSSPHHITSPTLQHSHYPPFSSFFYCLLGVCGVYWHWCHLPTSPLTLSLSPPSLTHTLLIILSQWKRIFLSLHKIWCAYRYHFLPTSTPFPPSLFFHSSLPALLSVHLFSSLLYCLSAHTHFLMQYTHEHYLQLPLALYAYYAIAN